MKLKILKEKLNKALGVVSRIAKKRTDLPILDNILLETQKTFLKINATNLESSVIWKILTKNDQKGKVAVPAELLKSLTGFIKEEEVNLESKKGNLLIKTDNQKNKIQGANVEDFPIIPNVSNKEYIEVESKELERALNKIVNIPSPSQIKPEISGIYFHFNKNNLKVVATDSFRLAEKTISLPEKNKKETSFILPQASVKNLINILSLKEGKLRVYLGENQVKFEWWSEETDSFEVRFLSRLVEGEYPNYKEIIPDNYNTKITLEKNKFKNQVKKAGLFSGKISEVKISSSDDKLKILSENSDVGKNESIIESKIEGDDIPETSFNYKFLNEGLDCINSSEVRFNVSEKNGPASLIPVGKDDFIYVLMPIKK